MKMRMASPKEDVVKKTDQIIEDRVKSELSRFKTDMEDKIKKDMESKGLQDTELKNKISKIMDDVSKQREKALAKDKEVDKDAADCPTCHAHVHRSVTNGTRVKCVGANCGNEYEMVDVKSDLQCVGCGVPLKSEAVKNKDDGCPFCHGTKARRFDWSKLWLVKK